jgi:hypothetical protein
MTEKIFFASETIFFAAERIFFVIQTIFFMSKTIVAAAKTIIFEVGQSFASPKLVVFGARSPLASLLIQELIFTKFS